MPRRWMLVVAALAAFSQEKPHEMERAEWDRQFFLPRQLGTSNHPAAHLAAYKKLESERPSAIATAGPWRELGPRTITRRSPLGPLSGRVTSLAIDPRDPNNRFYLGTANGGIWASTNGGTSWTSINSGLPFSSIGAIAVDPRNPDTLYAGMGDPEGQLGIGVYVSTDRGLNWEAFPGPLGDTPGTFRCLVIHPSSGDLYACINRAGLNPNTAQRDAGLFRYSFATGEWSLLLASGGVDRLLINPANPQVMYATLFTYNTRAGIYKSTDGGDTWKQSNGTLAQTNQASRLEVALAPSAPDTLYAAVALGSEAKLYKSTDGAVNWQAITTPTNYCGGQCFYNNSIVVHPTRPDVVFVGGVWLYRSTDGGRTFTNILEIGLGEYSGAYVDYHFLVMPPNASKLIVGNDGGIFQFNDPAGTLRAAQSLNAGLGLMLARGKVSTAPNDLNFAMVGTQDLLTQRYTGSLTWDASAITYSGTGCGDGGHAAIDPSNVNNIFVTCFTRDLLRSTNKGLTFTSGRANIPATDRTYGNPPILYDPATPRRLYYGTYRVWMSNDGGATFTAISDDLAPSVPNEPVGALYDMALSGSTLYASTTRGQVWACVNPGPGAEWKLISGADWPRNLTSIAVDPTDAQHVVAAVTGYFPKHVFESFDGGESWQDISGNLPIVPVISVAFDPDSTGTIYLGTDLGAFVTRGGHFWEILGDGLPRIPVTSIAMHKATRTLRAGTYGRGLWDLRIPRAPAVCSYSVLDEEFELDADAQIIFIPVGASEGCGYFVAGIQPDWAVVVSGSFGIGDSEVVLEIAENDTGEERTAAVTIAGRTILLRQKGE